MEIERWRPISIQSSMCQIESLKGQIVIDLLTAKDDEYSFCLFH